MSEAPNPTVIFVAAAQRTSGVGDYADQLLLALQNSEFDIKQIRIRNSSSFLNLVESIRVLRKFEAELRGRPYILHAELSAAAPVPFWISVFSRTRIRTATIHDGPRAVWFPFGFGRILRNRYFNYVLHYPFRKLIEKLEWKLLKLDSAICLSWVAANNVRENTKIRKVQVVPHFVPSARAEINFPAKNAIGLFGHVYGAKGFDSLMYFRQTLPKDIDIFVAGRGTEKLHKIPGVTYLGEVSGKAEADFFRSVSFVLLPYSRQTRYGTMHAASGVAALAASYGTPTIACETEVFKEYEHLGGMKSIPGGVPELSQAVSELLKKPADINILREKVFDFSSKYTPAKSANSYVEIWEELNPCSGLNF